MTRTRCAPDGSSRPVRIARAARDNPGGVILACSQVPAVAGPAGDHEVTCLAHVDSETLAAAGVHSRRVTLQRGDCAVCPLAIHAPGANGVLEPVDDPVTRIEATAARADALLERSGAEGQFDVVEVEPEPATSDDGPGVRSRRRGSRSQRPDTGAGGISRRDLFFAARKDDDPVEEGLSVPAPTPQRGVLLAALPKAVVDHPVAEPGCTGCRICEQVCPEDAFGWSGVGGNGLLWVMPAECTACGLCVQACPEDVLSLDAVAPADSGHQLARLQPRGCSRCGRSLVPGEQDVCTACSSRRSLLDDVWKHLG